MARGFFNLARLGSLATAFLMVATMAHGQALATLTGTVLDSSGATIPGATISARNVATNVTSETTSSMQGTFSIPALPPGVYTVTVTLEGFKTGVFNDVQLNAGLPTAINARLEVGGLAETVTVEGATALVQTVSSAVSSTINTAQIEKMPLPSRNVLDFVTRLPGVETSGGSRQSSISGLPRSAINITLDGINVQDNTLRTTDGFFTIVQPRLDAIEEVTVSMAAGEAVGGGQGAVQIRFTTRSGTNTYSGSLYHYFRHDRLNENTWFNIRNEVDKPSLLQHQRGGRFGGPVRIPGLFDGRGKAFFFLNIENFYQPADVTRNRTILHPRAQQGIFRYDIGGGVVREVNLIELAANNGQTATMDPTIQQLLADIRQATTTTGTVTPLANPLHEQYRYNLMNEQDNWFPTYRVDYNFTDRHRFSTVLNWHKFSSVPDTLNLFEPYFPGFPVMGSQTSRRGSSSNTLRSTFGANVVNEFRVGYQGSPVEFFNEQFDEGIWNQPFGGQAGHHLGLTAAGISNAGPAPNAQSRNVNTIRVENTLSWMRGSHSISVGGMFDRMDSWNKFRRTVPFLDFGMVTSGGGDPALGMFTTDNFPGASAANLTAARNLYAVLTGRVSQVAAIARLDAATTRYVYSGLGLEESRLETLGFFAQDSWRVRPNLSLNLGVRYDVQRPFRALNDSYATVTPDGIWGVSGYRPGCDMSRATPGTCNIFKPGEMPGQPTQYHQFMAGTAAYNTDMNNIAPSVGFNWTPERRGGALGRLMGQSGDFVIRGGFARAFEQPGMSDYRGRFSTNPGFAITVARNASLGNLGPLPLLMRDSARLAAPPFPEAPEYPNEGLITNSANMFDPNIQLPYADTWTVGFQRALSRNMAGEVRYVGTRSRNQWTTYNFNETNIIETGLLNEFRIAQANLQANVAAGLANQGFRYRGPGTGTQPLPVMFAYLQGAGDPTNAASYTSNFWTTQTTFLNPLARFNPNPFGWANALDADPTRRANALAAGLPANFLRANPHKLGGANVHGHGGFSNYNSVQFELRRRLANGFQANASYVYGLGEQSARYSFRVPRETVKRAGLTEGEVTHALKTDWMLDLPFGQGRRFGTNAGGVLDRIIGGWQVHGFLRVQSGVWANFGNVRMVGFNEKDLRKMYKLRINENQRVFMLPQDVVDNTVRAFSVSPTSPTGYGAQGPPEGRYFAPAMGPDCLETIAFSYGECGTRELAVRGPLLKLADISVVKSVPIVNRVRAEFRAEMLNAFNWVNFVPVASTSTNPALHEVGGLRGDPTSRIIQLVSRITW
jgi:hypothetical protein